MDSLGTDMTRVASGYAAFAGLLAGFVFAVMGYLLGSRPDRDTKRSMYLEAALSWAVLAFVGLSLSSFLFALLSGEDRFGLPTSPSALVGPTRARPLVLDVVASANMSSAILVLLLGLNWLFHRERVSVWFGLQLRLVQWLVGLLTMFYLYGAIVAVPIAENKRAPNDMGPLGLLFAIWIAAVVCGEIVGGVLRRITDEQNQIPRFFSQILLLLFFVVCTVGFNFIDFQDDSTTAAWPIADYTWPGVILLSVVVFICVLNLPNWQNAGKGAKDKDTMTAKSQELTAVPAESS